MKSTHTHNTNYDDNLKTALLKILIDLNIELPEDINNLKIDKEENIENKDSDNKDSDNKE